MNLKVIINYKMNFHQNNQDPLVKMKYFHNKNL